jgi:hypothetical protein
MCSIAVQDLVGSESFLDSEFSTEDLDLDPDPVLIMDRYPVLHYKNLLLTLVKHRSFFK